MQRTAVYFIGSADAAARLGLSRSQVNRLAASGEIPAEKLGSVWMFSSDDIDRFANERTNSE